MFGIYFDFSIIKHSDAALHIPYMLTGLHALSVLTKHTFDNFKSRRKDSITFNTFCVPNKLVEIHSFVSYSHRSICFKADAMIITSGLNLEIL